MTAQAFQRRIGVIVLQRVVEVHTEATGTCERLTTDESSRGVSGTVSTIAADRGNPDVRKTGNRFRRRNRKLLLRKPELRKGYERPPLDTQNFVPEIY